MALDSTVFVRLSFATQASGWIVGTIEWRRHGAPDRSRIQGVAGDAPGRYRLAYRTRGPGRERVHTVGWLVADTVLRVGLGFVQDADSLEFRRVPPDAPHPSVVEVVTVP
jgi:hypothetical protein